MDHASVLPRILAYHLLEEMTNGFSEDRELGRGSYGKVYLVWKTKVYLVGRLVSNHCFIQLEKGTLQHL
jgi:hypothetical protein